MGHQFAAEIPDLIVRLFYSLCKTEVSLIALSGVDCYRAFDGLFIDDFIVNLVCDK